MKIMIKTRYGKEVEFERKEKVFFQKHGESFMTALVRTYYPAKYREHQAIRKVRLSHENGN